MAMEIIGKPRLRMVPLIDGHETMWWRCTCVKSNGEQSGGAFGFGFKAEDAYQQALSSQPLFALVPPDFDDIQF